MHLHRKLFVSLKGIDKTDISASYYQNFVLIQVSSDLSIVDLDIPFSLIFAVGATTNACSNLGVLAVVTWQVLFVSIPVIFLAIRLQVILCKVSVFMCKRQFSFIFHGKSYHFSRVM